MKEAVSSPVLKVLIAKKKAENLEEPPFVCKYMRHVDPFDKADKSQ